MNPNVPQPGQQNPQAPQDMSAYPAATYTPGTEPAPAPIAQPVAPAPTPAPETLSQEQPQPAATPAPAVASQPVIETPEVIPAPEEAPMSAAPAPVQDVPLQWHAHEYVHIDKGVWWYVIFIVAALALIALDVFFFKSWTFSALIVVMVIALIVYIRRPPRELQYSLSLQQGVYVGERLYPFENFKSFGVIDDDGHQSIMLIPVKRFAPGLSVYFPEEIGEQLVDMLAARLPMEPLKLDVIDVVVRKLRL